MSWMRSGTELSQFLRVFPTYSCQEKKGPTFSTYFKIKMYSEAVKTDSAFQIAINMNY